jgi:hypothetical protein
MPPCELRIYSSVIVLVPLELIHFLALLTMQGGRGGDQPVAVCKGFEAASPCQGAACAARFSTNRNDQRCRARTLNSSKENYQRL